MAEQNYGLNGMHTVSLTREKSYRQVFKHYRLQNTDDHLVSVESSLNRRG
jgi:hypothetical protein